MNRIFIILYSFAEAWWPEEKYATRNLYLFAIGYLVPKSTFLF